MGFNLGGMLGGAGTGASIGSIFGPIGTAVGAIAGGGLGGFGGTTEQGGGQTINTTTPSQQLLYEWIQKYLPQYTPGQQYTGQMVAPKTPQETTSLSLLSQYLGAPNVGELGNAAQSQLMNTLSGQYMNPETSPYIQAQQRMAQRGLEDAISKSRLGQGSRGKFYSTAGLQEEGRLTGASQDYLNTLIGQFIQNERQNQVGAVAPAMAMEEYVNKTTPLAKISAGQSYGSLDRTLQQADLEAQYQNWSKARSEMSSIPSLLQGSQTGMNWTMPTTSQNSTLGNIMQLLNNQTVQGSLGSIFGGGRGGGTMSPSLFQGAGTIGANNSFIPF